MLDVPDWVWRFLIGVWHIDLDLNMVMILAWIIPEVLISTVEAENRSVSLSLYFPCPCGAGAGAVWVRVRC